MRTYNYPLRLTKAQEAVLDKWRVLCQQLYNGALEQRREAWRKQRRSVNYLHQQAELTELRAQDQAFAAVPAWVLRSSLRRLDLAYKAFFRRCKRGETPGFPRFRSRDRYDSFDFGTDPVRINGNRFHVPKLGPVKFHLYRPLPDAPIKLARVKRRPYGKWVLSLVLDLGTAPPKRPVRTATGIDVGLTTFATLADGTAIENPRFFRKSEDQLARRQQAVALKKRGSMSRRRARLIVAKTYERMRNQRLDFARKLAVELYDRYDLIAHEDLHIARMTRGNLGKSIHDAAWGVFLHALACKAEEAGKHLVAVDPRGTTKRCSRCSADVSKTLAEREHVCDRCGLRLGRDHNAAINIHALGLSAATEGSDA